MTRDHAVPVTRTRSKLVSDDVGSADPCLVGLLVGEPGLALALGLDAAKVMVDLVGRAGVVPAELTGHQPGGRACRMDAAVEGLDGDARTPREDVVEVTRALVGDGVRDLGGQELF